MSIDRPLTDAQERALIHLSESGAGLFVCPPGCRPATLDVLARLGLVELREQPLVTSGRITEEGRALLRSMGD